MDKKNNGKILQPTADRVERLYAEYHPLLLRYIEKIIRSKDDAEEIVQEAYARVLALQDEYTVEYWRSYLFRVAHNIAIDRIKVSTRYRKRMALIKSQMDEDVGVQLTETPDSHLVALQLEQQFETSLAQLPSKCSRAFRLYRFEGKSYQEIATLMAVSESMVRKHVIRALLHCKDSLLQRD